VAKNHHPIGSALNGFTPRRNPVACLVAGWRHLRLPTPPQVMGYREALFSATLEEVRLQSAAGVLYDPSEDYRFKWACQWLAVAEGSLRRVDQRLCDIVEFMCAVCPVSGKQRATGDAQEVAETLTPGSP